MKLEDIKKLHQKKYRQALGHYLVEGEHLVLELQKAAARQPELNAAELYVTGAYEHWPSPLRTHQVNERQMAQLADTHTPQGILAVVPMPDKSVEPAPKPCQKAIYLHEIQDPGNLGTILRTLAWFGGFRCLLSPGSVDPYNPKVVRASMGAIFHVPIETEVPLDTLNSRYRSVAWIWTVTNSQQSLSAGTIATCSGTKPAAFRPKRWHSWVQRLTPYRAKARSNPLTWPRRSTCVLMNWLGAPDRRA